MTTKNFNPRAHEGHDLRRADTYADFPFQSTCPRGARRGCGLDDCSVFISIHVPTRGTTRVLCKTGCRGYFNPRAHEGHDAAAGAMQMVRRFQSTCPRGARRGREALPLGIYNFNPRAHEGHDVMQMISGFLASFQSTCPRGARREVGCYLLGGCISIHVPTRGTTRCLGSGRCAG